MPEVWILDCRRIELSPEKSGERINKALRVFPQRLLMRLVAFVLHLLGARRKAVAELVGMPEESVKTLVRVALRDGFEALRDRRGAETPPVAVTQPAPLRVALRRSGDRLMVDLGLGDKPMKIPLSSQVQARTVVLSLVNAGLLSLQEAAAGLAISVAHCRELARELADNDVMDALVDKRQGQKRDYRVGPAEKAELIQQLAARAITGRSTSSEVLAEAISERTEVLVSPRAVRWHVRRLGPSHISKTLPGLVESLKKNNDPLWNKVRDAHAGGCSRSRRPETEWPFIHCASRSRPAAGKAFA